MEKDVPSIYIVNVYPMNARSIINADFLDILFDGRNKDYGAYDLRRNADKRVRNALVGTASFALVIIGGYVLSNNLRAADMPTRNDIVKVKPIAPIDPIVEEKRVTPPPPVRNITPPPASSSIRVTPPVITRNDLVHIEDEVPKLDSIEHKTIGVANRVGPDSDFENPFEGTGTGDRVVEGPAIIARAAPDVVVDFVEVMPAYPGGESALAKFLSKNIRYPHMAQENGIDGKVFVQFVVRQDGTISDVQTVGAAKGGGLEEEAMRVVKMMPKWKPGRQNGQPTSVRFNLPVGFVLQN